MAQNNNKIEELLTRGVENIYPNKDILEKELKSGKKLRVYCGYDPTSQFLHIGHLITLKKLAQFQNLGHEVIMLIGDFTGMIGDPTDKLAVRKKLTREQVLANSRDYQKQASHVLDFQGENPVKLIYNSQWNDKLSFLEIIELASYFTVGQMLARDMFQKRLEKDKPIYLHEFLYPLIQAYDSVVMDIDVEVGGNDQSFNMLAGRDLMKALKNKEKIVLTTKLLVDSTGKKMGKSEGNLVALNEKPAEMFGQIMSWPDELILPALELCTEMPMEEIKQIGDEMKEGGLNPRDVKARLAKEIVSIYHSPAAAEKAEQEFDKIFKGKEEPSQIKAYVFKPGSYALVDLLVKLKMASSKSEARRKIEQTGVKVDRQVVRDWQTEIEIKEGMIIQAGKRQFAKLKTK